MKDLQIDIKTGMRQSIAEIRTAWINKTICSQEMSFDDYIKKTNLIKIIIRLQTCVLQLYVYTVISLVSLYFIPRIFFYSIIINVRTHDEFRITT